jgi:hypothetical protein
MCWFGNIHWLPKFATRNFHLFNDIDFFKFILSTLGLHSRFPVNIKRRAFAFRKHRFFAVPSLFLANGYRQDSISIPVGVYINP